MKTTLIVGNDVPDFDRQITDQLRLEFDGMKAIKRERMLIGIRNHQGNLYRAIGVTGLDRFLDAVFKLKEIGLIDELEHEDEPREGCDAIFVKR
jgi:hypothetical protein